jgi:dCMP deaminase
MIGSTLYLVGKEVSNNQYVKSTQPCSMCKREIINAGIETVIVRDNYNDFRTIKVQEWIDNDETLNLQSGY